MKRKRHPDWCEHPKICEFVTCWEHPNGFICSGYVKNNKEKFPSKDVICFCETFFNYDTNLDDARFGVMTINEVLETIHVLTATVLEFNLNKKQKKRKKK